MRFFTKLCVSMEPVYLFRYDLSQELHNRLKWCKNKSEVKNLIFNFVVIYVNFCGRRVPWSFRFVIFNGICFSGKLLSHAVLKFYNWAARGYLLLSDLVPRFNQIFAMLGWHLTLYFCSQLDSLQCTHLIRANTLVIINGGNFIENNWVTKGEGLGLSIGVSCKMVGG